jgi:hypothetical protein
MDIIDTDVHIRWSSLDEIAPYFGEPWRTQLLRGRRLDGLAVAVHEAIEATGMAALPTGGSCASPA